MGEAGRKRAREKYEWKVIIQNYENLWNELNNIRKTTSKDIKPMTYPWPARMDPFNAFEAYPTKKIQLDSKIDKVEKNLSKGIEKALKLRQSKMVTFAEYVLPSEDEIKMVMNSLDEKAKTIKEIINFSPEEKHPHLLRSFGWLLKMGVVKMLTDKDS